MSPRRELLFEGVPMSAREVRIARHAFNDGALYGRSPFVNSATSVAAAQYPLPKVTRPRVVKDSQHSTGEWKVDVSPYPEEPPVLWWRRRPHEEWEVVRTVERLSADRAHLWADLFARPTEEVDVE